jgi:uncharacterized RDD family membrane protein YckC
MSRAREHDAAITLQGHYAGAVTRLAAFAIDQTVATTAFSVATAVLAWTVSLVTSSDVKITGTWWTIGIYLLWLFLYYAYPWSVSGKTVGMALLGIRVVRADGSRCGPRAAAVRALTLPLGFLTLGLGFLGILIGREHRALYDRIAGTAVVYAWDAKAAGWRFLARQGNPAAPDGTNA